MYRAYENRLSASENDLEPMLLQLKKKYCKYCGCRMRYVESGSYHCMKCGSYELDDFGKIKKFLQEYPGSTIPIISNVTGVDREVIKLYLKKGDIEIAQYSSFFLKCEMCGTEIRSGRICPLCAKNYGEKLKGYFIDEVGAIPRKTEMIGKMRFLNKERLAR